MELVDFNKWLDTIHESVSGINIVFKIDSDYSELVESTYLETLKEHLDKTLPPSITHEISKHSDTLINVSLLSEEDEVSTTMFGPTESTNFLLALPNRGLYGQLIGLGPNQTIEKIKKHFYNAIVEKGEDFTSIRVRGDQQTLDSKIISIAKDASSSSNFSTSGHRFRDKTYTEPTIDDYFNLLDAESKTAKDEVVHKLSVWAVYETAIKVLNLISSQLTIDTIAIKKEIATGLNAALNSKTDEEKLPFMKRLMDLANPKRYEESALVTDALIEMFRDLLKHYESPIEIWRAIYKKK
jgi:hypothetical protein